MRINLTDNNTGQSDVGVFPRGDVAALFPAAGKTTAELCGENENLLMFPYGIKASDDMIGESSIMSMLNTGDPDKVRITAGNIMGFIGVDNFQIKMKPGSDRGRDNYLLHYILQKALSFNLFDFSHNNEKKDVSDFIIFIFPYFLKAAIRQGVYKEYQNFSHSDANLRGTINVAQHIAKNVSFVGNIVCLIREYSHDNNMTELIRRTAEFMKTKRYGQSVLNADHEIIKNVKAIIGHISLYNENERDCIISRNLRVKTHPYSIEYHPLQILYLQILRMNEIKYSESNSDICDILFDGAWLWEEYVNTILRDYDFKRLENRLYKGGIYLLDDHGGIYYPDFYKGGMVLDAKYKLLGSYDKTSEVDSDDIHQVIAYITALKVDQGGFVASLNQRQSNISASHLKGSSATLSICGTEINKIDTSYMDFYEDTKEMECVFVESLH